METERYGRTDMKIEMNEILVKAHRTMAYEYKKDFIQYELIDPLNFCCSVMKDFLDSEHSNVFDSRCGNLNRTFTIDNGDNPTTYEHYRFDFCPFCGEEIVYEIIGKYKDSPIYKEQEIWVHKHVLENTLVFDKLERRKI